MDLEDLTWKVCELTEVAGGFIRAESGKIAVENIEVKGLHDFVTYVDKNAEKMLVKGLRKLLPEAGFITEEDTASEIGKHYTWIVDPLDGTTNFIHAIPCFSISIALMCDTEIVLGVIYEINLNECFYAWQGSKAYLNGKEIKVSATSKLKDSLLITGFPNRDYSLLDEYLSLFRFFMEETHGLRRFGSAAVDLAYVACGRGEGFYEYGLSAWDVAAGALIVKQAGGKVSDFKGGSNYLFGGYTYSESTKSDGWIIKLDVTGKKVWEKKFGGSKTDCFYGITPDNNGSFVAVGYTESKGAGNMDAWAVKINAFGEKEWEKTYGEYGEEKAYAIDHTTDGGYVITGYNKTKGNRNVCMSELDR